MERDYPKPHEIEKYKDARIIEIGFIILDEDLKIKFEFSSLVYSQDYNKKHLSSEIHGITLDMLQKNGRPIHHIFKVLHDNILTFNVQHLIAHNIRFDYNILLSELHRSYQSFMTRSQSVIVKSLLSTIPSLHQFCTMAHGRKLSHFNGRSPKLSALHQYLTGNSIVQNHRAIDDVFLCFDCFIKLKHLSILV